MTHSQKKPDMLKVKQVPNALELIRGIGLGHVVVAIGLTQYTSKSTTFHRRRLRSK
jgi:hypothetical protein